MKGLIIKDLCFITQQKKTFVIMAFLFIWFIVLQGADSAPFVISYMTLMGGMTAISIISYDDYDKSMAFLLTLPVKRTEYVLEKYIFSLGSTAVFWALSTMIYLFVDVQGRMETLIAALVLLLLLSAFQLVMLPVQIKYGGDKGRVVLLGMVVFLVLGAYAACMIAERFYKIRLEALADQVVNSIISAGPWAVGGTALLFWCIALAISVIISIRFMERKEF